MRLKLLGVRGSTPAPGPAHVRYGGHTSCIAVSPAQGSAPDLFLDAGTGLRMASALLDGAPFVGTILLSHLHWDHMQGIPFFGAGDRDGAQVQVVLPAQLGRSGRDLMAQCLAPPAFPITPEGLNGRWTFDALEPGPVESAGYRIDCFEVAHKGGRTYGYRVADERHALAYLPDHAPGSGVSAATAAALAGVDLLIHDAQFLDSERARADDYGHATVDDAIALAAQLHVGSLMLFHHGPFRTDDQLDQIADQVGGAALPFPVLVAREGDEVVV